MSVFANVSGNINATVQLSETVSTGVVASINYPANDTNSLQFVNAAGALGIDELYSKQLTLAAAATTIDLQSFTDIAGTGSVNAARVRAVYVKNLAAVGSGFNLVVGNATTNSWSGALSATGTVTLPPQGVLLLLDPSSSGAGVGFVTSATSLNLKLDPGANTLSCNVILGCNSVA